VRNRKPSFRFFAQIEDESRMIEVSEPRAGPSNGHCPAIRFHMTRPKPHPTEEFRHDHKKHAKVP
jgi:hypothetical protein